MKKEQLIITLIRNEGQSSISIKSIGITPFVALQLCGEALDILKELQLKELKERETLINEIGGKSK